MGGPPQERGCLSPCLAGRTDERSFGLSALAVCYHNLAVQKLFLDKAKDAGLCAKAALRLVDDTKCLGLNHPWVGRIRHTIAACAAYEDELPRAKKSKRKTAGGERRAGRASQPRVRKSADEMRTAIKNQKNTRNGKAGKGGKRGKTSKPRATNIKYTSDGRVHPS